MKKLILTLFVLAGVSGYANAQLGVTSNYQLSYHKSDYTLKNAVLNGWCGGLVYDIWLAPGFAIEPGILYSYGSNVRTGYSCYGDPIIRNAGEAVTEHYFHIPIQGRVVVPMGMATSMSLYFGPTLALALDVPPGYSGSGMMMGGGVGLDLGPLTLKTGYDFGTGYRGAFTVGLTFSFGSNGWATPTYRTGYRDRGTYRTPAPRTPAPRTPAPGRRPGDRYYPKSRPTTPRW